MYQFYWQIRPIWQNCIESQSVSNYMGFTMVSEKKLKMHSVEKNLTT